MRTVEEYLRHAEECETLARRAFAPEQKAALSQVAETWRRIADQRQKLIIPARSEHDTQGSA